MHSHARDLLKVVIIACTLAVVGLASGCASEPGASELAAPKTSWQKVVPGGETECSDGSEFAFYTRAGDPKKLLFYLQGGGACWNLQTCDPLGKPSYTVNLEGFHPSQADGIFDFSLAANPLLDHTIVFVPYCSADVHLGAATKSYQRPADWIDRLQENGVPAEDIAARFSVAHRGLANARAALNWVQETVTKPRTVLVAGSSAGSIPSPYYAVQLAAQYPRARVSQLGDGSGGYRRLSQRASPHLAWNTIPELVAEPAFASLDDASFNFEQLYVLAHAAQPRIRMHAYDTAEDAVQLQFLKLGGVPVASLQESIALNQADIRHAVPAFRSYIAAGELHTILRRSEFYEFSASGRTLRDWVADIVAGREVSSVIYTPNP